MGSQALNGKRRQAFMLKPEDLTLVYDESHPLYDERVHLPVVEAWVLSIMSIGVRVAIKVRKNGPLVEVVDGRGRVKAALEANVRLKAEGLPHVLIACEVERGSDAFLAALGISLNEHRRPDDPLTRAKKMQRLSNLGQSPEEIGLAFGLGVKAVKHNLGLLELAAPVQKAVAAGELGPTLAVKNYRPLERSEQVALLNKERKDGILGTAGSGKARRRKKAPDNGTEAPAIKRPSAKCLSALSKDARLPAGTRWILAWAAGSLALDALPAKFQEIARDRRSAP